MIDTNKGQIETLKYSEINLVASAGNAPTPSGPKPDVLLLYEEAFF